MLAEFFPIDDLTYLRLPIFDTEEGKPFEALLRLKVTKGAAVETERVSLRKIASS